MNDVQVRARVADIEPEVAAEVISMTTDTGAQAGVTAEKNLAFDVAKGDWRVTGSYDEPDNIVFYHKGEVHKTITYPGYKIWNIAAHLDEILEDFEQGMSHASWTGFGSVEYAVKEETE